MIQAAKAVYNVIEAVLRLGALTLVFLVKKWVAFLSPRDFKSVSKKVFIVQFTPRKGVIGGDAVVNGYIKTLLERSGVSVEMIHPPLVRERMGPTRWLFGDHWAQNQALKKRIGKADCWVLIDSQLSLGLFAQPTVTICHYSFLGYTSLATQDVDLLGYLYSHQKSLIQAIGTVGARVVAVSAFQARFLGRELVRVDRVVANVQLPLASSSGQRADFVFLGGHAVYAKGFDILEGLGHRGWVIHCYTDFDGPGPLRYHPFVPHDQVGRVLQNYSILIHPSRYESCSMAVLEALSCGLPVLISNVGMGPDLRKVIPEFVVTGSGSAGLDEYEAKAKLIRENYADFSKRAQDYVTRFHSFEQFEAAWKEVFALDSPLP